MSIELTPIQTADLHISAERLGGLVSALIAHFQRENARELADLCQFGIEDVARIRNVLRTVGVSTSPRMAPPTARAVGPVSVRDAILPPDPLDGIVQMIEGAEVTP